MQIDGKRLSELAGRVTSAWDRNSRREEMEERRNLAELIRPPNGIAACVVTSGCKIHRPEWNAIPLWRGRDACVNTAKWGCIMYCWKGGEDLGWDSLDNPLGVDNKHMHLVTVQWQSPPGWDRHRTNCSVCACCVGSCELVA